MSRHFIVGTLAIMISSLLLPACGQPTEPIATATTPLQQVEDKDSGSAKKMADLVDKAKSKLPSINDTKKMLGDAGNATGETADETKQWVEDTFKALSDRGLTGAQNATDWVKQDWNAMNTWEYRVVTVSSEKIAEDPAALEQTLNESGKLRWDCFHISESPAGTKFFMKRQKKSYLKNIPLKDMLRLVPLLDGDSQ